MSGSTHRELKCSVDTLSPYWTARIISGSVILCSFLIQFHSPAFSGERSTITLSGVTNTTVRVST